ncbi:MAG: DUF4082 domain-containing protein [Motilibacteraceae bacterium]
MHLPTRVRAALVTAALVGAALVPAVAQAAATPSPTATAAPATPAQGPGSGEQGKAKGKSKPPGVQLGEKSDEGQTLRAPAKQLSATALTSPSAGRLAATADPCGTGGNAIACENNKPGTPSSTWDVSGAGDSGLQGFATDISVNVGDTVHFKIKATVGYRIEIYRLGYYQGNGARLITSFTPQVAGPQSQPACNVTNGTGLIDCGNWAESASWAVPSTAVSGVYLARLVRTDTGGDSHVPFIVRNDAGHSDVVFQTSDTTWEAYNQYGGNSLYTCTVGCPSGSPVLYKGASAVSYNRPFNTRAVDGGTDWLFYAEYPLIRFLERNGYDVSYIAGVDTDRSGALLKNHRAFLSVGHDEYWSGGQRANVEAARDAGVNLAFLSGNEVYWKTRFTADSSGKAYRTLVCYKESHYNAVVDPADPPTWTGTWRDGRFSPPADGGRPENGLTGTMFMADPPTNFNLQISAEFAKLRFWRNTAVAGLTGTQTATLSNNTLGYEFDSDLDNGFRPAGLIDMSRQVKDIEHKILDPYGNSEGAGTVTHSLTLYRAPSGALVFGAGTVQWTFGLDTVHDAPASAEDRTMQQATVNLFADMGSQPTTLMATLTQATASTDTTAPTAVITAPTGTVEAGTPVTVSGTASDTGGAVGGVELSSDGGSTWHPATGTATWTYTWIPTATGPATLKARATDDSGNIQGSPATATVNVVPRSCPCTIFGSTTPSIPDYNDATAYELGVKFRASVSGTVTGVRFYKGTGNTGTHTGSLWSGAGTRLATGTFSAETATGWQTLTFSTPVAITANTTYVASYHTNAGHYAIDAAGFATSGVDAPPLSALQDGADGGNGVYLPGSTSGFPNQTYGSTNYYVDIVFQTGTSTVTPTPTPTPTTTTPTATPTPSPTGTGPVTASLWPTSSTPGTASAADPNPYELGTRFRSDIAGFVTGVRFYKGPGNTGTHTGSLWTTGGTRLATGTFSNETAAGWQSLTFTSAVAITANTDYVVSYHTDAGNYAFDGGYFTVPRDANPLHAPASSASTPNGVFKDGASGFPSSTFNAANYWVDVLFTTSGTGSTPTPTPTSPTPTPTPTVACPCSLLTGVTPAVANSGDVNKVELGVRFTSDVPGQVTAIRFYKGSSNIGTHTGSLWSATGTRLATGTFSNETASGWQTLTFPTPVPINAGTAYVASYLAPSGNYSYTSSYFTSGRDVSPLHASSQNGVFVYGGGFPTSTYNSTNYFVDVVVQ